MHLPCHMEWWDTVLEGITFSIGSTLEFGLIAFFGGFDGWDDAFAVTVGTPCLRVWATEDVDFDGFPERERVAIDFAIAVAEVTGFPVVRRGAEVAVDVSVGTTRWEVPAEG